MLAVYTHDLVGAVGEGLIHVDAYHLMNKQQQDMA